MAKLSVNVNKIATLRNTRNTDVPSVVRLARVCLDAGAAGITVHPRPDQRHIRTSDVHALATLLQQYPAAEFNIEGNPFHGYMELIRAVRPTQCTLVPDDPSAFTSNAGWVFDQPTCDRLRPLIEEMCSLGCRVSLFVDPEIGAVDQAARLGAQRVELYTEPYAAAVAAGGAGQESVIARYVAAAEMAQRCTLGVNAGHDLNLVNLPILIHAIPTVLEVSIGHALIADALELGLAETVRRYAAAAALRCSSCGAPASVHLVEIVGGKRIERNMCEECARVASEASTATLATDLVQAWLDKPR